eukprot:TRINITY_DN28403_c0_g1_i1.p1 TRINITY_DN28403_c0_g1~~TRINITY_DN28403_c0_g1_i1.p1  ORF type:complete len:964 (-),score=319.52 TRINITY_DN28403_c0_g1_i1:130-3021(-)
MLGPGVEASPLAPTCASSRQPLLGDQLSLPQLELRLVDEVVEREATRGRLKEFSRALSCLRLELLTTAEGACRGPPGGAGIEPAERKLKSILGALQEAVEASLPPHKVQGSPSSPGSPPGSAGNTSLGVLRHSLKEAHARCESLALNMRKQLEAKQELAASLTSAKDGNKRLLEQIRTQTNEITSLTQQRVDHEQRSEDLRRLHGQDEVRIKQEMRRQILSMREAADGRRKSQERRLQDKLRHFRGALELLRQDVVVLAEEGQRLRSEASEVGQALQRQVEAAADVVVAPCVEVLRQGAAWHVVAQEALDDLQTELRSEQERRLTEGNSWSHRSSSVQFQLENLHSASGRRLQQLQCRLEAQERLLSAVRQEVPEEQPLASQLDGARRQRAECQDAHEQLGRRVRHLEASVSATTAETASADEMVADLQQRARVADDALAVAVSGNDFLRAQLEDQQQRMEERNEAELRARRDGLERRLKEAQGAAAAQSAMAGKQLQALEEDALKLEASRHSMSAQADTAAVECDKMRAELASVRALAVEAERLELEGRLQQLQQDFAFERHRLQAASGQVALEASELDFAVKRTEEDMALLRRSANAREAEAAIEMGSLDASLRSGKEEMKVLQSRLAEAKAAHEQLATVALTDTSHLREVEAALLRSVASVEGSLQEERQRCADELAGAQRAARDAREVLDIEREAAHSAMLRAEEETQSKLSFLASRRDSAEESHRHDAEEAMSMLTKRQSRMEALTLDMEHARFLLQNADGEAAKVRQETEYLQSRWGSDSAVLQEEIRTLDVSLDRLQHEEKAITKQLEAVEQRNERERLLLRKELDELKRMGPASVSVGVSARSTTFSPKARAAGSAFSPTNFSKEQGLSTVSSSPWLPSSSSPRPPASWLRTGDAAGLAGAVSADKIGQKASPSGSKARGSSGANNGAPPPSFAASAGSPRALLSARSAGYLSSR